MSKAKTWFDVRRMRLALTVLPVAALATGLATAGPANAQNLTFSVMASGTYDKAAEALAPAFIAKTGAKTTIAAFPWATLRQNNITDVVTGTNQFQVMSGGFYLADIYAHFI